MTVPDSMCDSLFVQYHGTWRLWQLQWHLWWEHLWPVHGSYHIIFGESLRVIVYYKVLNCWTWRPVPTPPITKGAKLKIIGCYAIIGRFLSFALSWLCKMIILHIPIMVIYDICSICRKNSITQCGWINFRSIHGTSRSVILKLYTFLKSNALYTK